MQLYHSKYCQAIISVELVLNSVKLLIFGFDMKNYIYIILLQIHYNTKIYYKSIILVKKVLPITLCLIKFFVSSFLIKSTISPIVQYRFSLIFIIRAFFSFLVILKELIYFNFSFYKK